jgi:hypothetical protein
VIFRYSGVTVLFRFFFVLDMDKFAIEHQVFLYESYVKCNTTRTCQRKFGSRFSGV